MPTNTSTTENDLASSDSRPVSAPSSTTLPASILSNLPRRNWNQNHPYSTRFKQTFSANIAALESTLPDDSLPLDHLTALLAEQSAVSSNEDGTDNLLQPFAYAAVDDDTLHYGQMRRAIDRDKFELDMQREVRDLLASQSITIVPRKDMPKDSKAVPAIRSFR